MIDRELKDLLPQITKAVREAGRIIVNASLDREKVSSKEGFANFVTTYDVQVQNYLIERLRTILPEAKYFGEEDHLNQSIDAKNGYLFIIDPIDGTTNFIFGYKRSCVSVGLAYCGKVVLGVVYNPYVNDMYCAVHGQGAFVNEKKLVLADRALNQGIAAFGCARYNTDDTDSIFAIAKELYLHSLSLREGGSAALDLCGIAAGQNVLYTELLLQPYDYAAASVIIEEAGGKITQVSGEAITLNKPCSILAGTAKAWQEGLQICSTVLY